MKKHTINWNRGSGELLSLIIVLPMILVTFIIMIALTQYSIAKQSLAYATYMSARQAVVCTDYETADRMAEIAAEHYELSAFRNWSSVTIRGTDMPGGSLTNWRHGNFIIVSVKANYDLLLPFNNTTIKSDIIMMIENDKWFNQDLTDGKGDK